MHRSGTSIAARVVQLLGAYLGSMSELTLGGLDNPDGFWERRGIHLIHERGLASLNSCWDTSRRLPANWQHEPGIAALREGLCEYVGENFGSVAQWAWKDPRTALFLPLWEDILGRHDIQLKCLIVIRNPLEVAQSLERRNGFSIEKGLDIWLNYNLAIIENTSGLPRAIVSYDALLGDWRFALKPCYEKLAIPWLGDDEIVGRAVDQSLKADLRHSRYEIGDLRAYRPAVKQLALVLDEAARSGNVDVAEGRLRQTRLLDYRVPATLDSAN